MKSVINRAGVFDPDVASIRSKTSLRELISTVQGFVDVSVSVICELLHEHPRSTQFLVTGWTGMYME